jgi:NAD+ kinase
VVATEVKVQRIALVVHPTRPIDGALATLREWSEERGVALLQPMVVGDVRRQVAPEGELAPGDFVVSLGGDGTVLSAMRAAAPVEAPVLGVSCGSLGALTVVAAGDIGAALDRVVAGDWMPRRLPALAIQPVGAAKTWAVNDFVVVRKGSAQVLADVMVDDELYARVAGDGLIVATPLGSSAYSMAAGGPVVVTGTPVLVCTPVAVHGGNAPPLVVPATSALRVTVHPGFGGVVTEIDGHPQPLAALEYDLRLHHEKLALVSFGEPGFGLAMLRERGLIADSPRVLARDRRARPSPRSVR